jgi:hypothetical protein
MTRNKKWLKLAALIFGGSTLFQIGGCLGGGGGGGGLGAFWDGFWNTGWPTDNRVLNIAIDILNEELFG